MLRHSSQETHKLLLVRQKELHNAQTAERLLFHGRQKHGIMGAEVEASRNKLAELRVRVAFGEGCLRPI